jgi:diguanylate cyclase (GGDEF)-like protein
MGDASLSPAGVGQTAAAPSPISPDGDRKPRLLVVDDQAINVQALYQAFAADHQVLMATNGEQALKVCASKQPDLVLLDVMMPGLDGYEVCQRLKADEATRDIPVIFVTAHHDTEAEARGLDVGAVDFISKPINPRIVRARVKTHLTLKRQSDLLRQWVYIDGLTGVHNRRFFDERLRIEWARALRQDLMLSVVLIDVDYFKRYNDHYGHGAGDDCLRRVAQCMQAVLKRPPDLLARYGGEEFVVLLPDTHAAGAAELARQLGAAVRGLALPHAQSAVSSTLTVSLGVCTKPAGVALASELDAATLLKRADEALYGAKQGGRDQVVTAVLGA